MLKLRTVQLVLISLLVLILLVGLNATGSGGHAALPLAGEANAAAQTTYKTFMPIISTNQWLTNCRYGVGNKPGQEAKKWMGYLGIGSYVNFSPRVYGDPILDSIELLPLVRIKQDRSDGQFLPSYTVYPPLTMDPGGLGPMILNNLGAVWLMGNEPDVDNPVQDRMLPEWYARAYHEAYYFIKGLDPTAQVAVAGLSMMTPGRLQYLDILWDTYQQEFGEPMPVDVWNTHLYILPEIDPVTGEYSDGKVALGTDPALAKKSPVQPYAQDCPRDDVYCRAEHDDIGIFRDQLIALRTWMKNHGQQNKPLILTEYSLLYPYIIDYDNQGNPIGCYLSDEFGNCFTPQRVTNFLHKSIDFLESARDTKLGYPADDYRLVQQWTWYSFLAEDGITGQSSNLMADDYTNYKPGSAAGLTQVGRAYRDRAAMSERTVNLVAGAVPTVYATTTGATADVTLRAGFYNNGSAGIRKSFRVTFYEDAGLTQVIGVVDVSPGITGTVNGCSWGRTTDWATIDWQDVPLGIKDFWVKIDSYNQVIGEKNENDNVAQGQVVVEAN